MDILRQYSFPGNVRELENIIERSVALETSTIVLPESLTLSHFQKDQLQASNNRRYTDLTLEGFDLNHAMSTIESDYVIKAIDLAQGSKQTAAEILGISFESLRYRIAKLKIPS